MLQSVSKSRLGANIYTNWICSNIVILTSHKSYSDFGSVWMSLMFQACSNNQTHATISVLTGRALYLYPYIYIPLPCIMFQPSQPSERMPGVSRGQAILNARPQYPVDASPPVGDGRGAPALPPKLPLNGPPPRYQPPPQYSPYLRRSADGPPPNGPPKGHPGQPQG